MTDLYSPKPDTGPPRPYPELRTEPFYERDRYDDPWETEPGYRAPWQEQLDETTDTLARINELMRRLEESPRRDSYEFFRNQEQRLELFDYCAQLTERLHDTGIADLVIVDRSSRPLWIGVKEYWKAKYPDEEMPGIYFLNPKGFKSMESTSPEEQMDAIEDSLYKDDRREFSDVRPKDEIIAELTSVYRRLMLDKDKPVMLFDACLHSGKTLKPVVDIMREVGFSNLQVGVVSDEDVHFDAALVPDFALTSRFPAKGCYPFDRDRMIEKTFDHVYSLPTQDDYKVQASARLRHEIRKIMQEELSAQQGRRDTLDLREPSW